MKSKIRVWGMLAAMLLFGMMVTGCDNNGGDINILDTMSLTSGAPSATALSDVELS